MIPANESRGFAFFSHVLLQIMAILFFTRANSHEKASRSCSKIRRDRPYSLIALLALDWENSSDFPCRCGLVNTTNDSREQWDRLYYFAKRVAPRAPRAPRYIILHSFLILLMSHPWYLLIPSRINSRLTPSGLVLTIDLIGHEEDCFVKLRVNSALFVQILIF